MTVAAVLVAAHESAVAIFPRTDETRPGGQSAAIEDADICDP